MTNITGEKLSVNQVIEAMQHATKQIGFADSYFIVEADAEKSRYILKLELPADIPKEKGRVFVTSFDDYLKHVNIEYKSKRDSMRLAIPILHVMRQGWYDRHHRELVEGGKNTFQMKTQILSLAKSQSKKDRSEIGQIIES
jgi:phage host-nuclease inhibitor protein Gam